MARPTADGWAVVSARMPPDLLADVARVSELLGVDRSALVRLALRQVVGLYPKHLAEGATNVEIMMRAFEEGPEERVVRQLLEG